MSPKHVLYEHQTVLHEAVYEDHSGTASKATSALQYL
jgi:hypothetical protein